MNFIVILTIIFGLLQVFNTEPHHFKQYLIQEEDEEYKRYLPWENEHQMLTLVDFKIDSKVSLLASLQDVTYYLYTRENALEPFIVKNGSNIEHFFNKTKHNVFLIHGWLNNYTSPMPTLLTTAILNRHSDFNVFVVDWSPIAHSFYFRAKSSVQMIGKYVADFLNDMMKAYDLDGSRFTLIGHSLGAHVAGNAASAINNSRIGHIIGLDPAGPFFSLRKTENRLDPGDAEFVQVIHTCGRRLGFFSSIGHMDIFPNGGWYMHGCSFDLFGLCSHSRSYMYMAEAIQDDSKFQATLCESWRNYKYDKCAQNVKVPMGRLDVNRSLRGDFYLFTESKSPFAYN